MSTVMDERLAEMRDLAARVLTVTRGDVRVSQAVLEEMAADLAELVVEEAA